MKVQTPSAKRPAAWRSAEGRGGAAPDRRSGITNSREEHDKRLASERATQERELSDLRAEATEQIAAQRKNANDEINRMKSETNDQIESALAEANKKLADVREQVSKMMTDAQRRASEITDTAKAKHRRSPTRPKCIAPRPSARSMPRWSRSAPTFPPSRMSYEEGQRAARRPERTP